MYQAVKDGISHGWVADIGMPFFDGELGRNDGGCQCVTVLNHFEESRLSCALMGERPRSSRIRTLVFANFFMKLG